MPGGLHACINQSAMSKYKFNQCPECGAETQEIYSTVESTLLYPRGVVKVASRVFTAYFLCHKVFNRREVHTDLENIDTGKVIKDFETYPFSALVWPGTENVEGILQYEKK